MPPGVPFSCQSFVTKKVKICHLCVKIITLLFIKIIKKKLLVAEITKQGCSEHESDEEDSG